MVAAAAESAGAPPAGSWRAAAAAAALRLGAAADAAEAAAAAAAAAAAVAGGGSSGDADYSAETARRARSAAAKAAKAAAGATEEALAAGGARAARTIRRVRCEDLSLREFRAGVQARSEPLVITGLGDVLTEDGADGAELQWLRRHAASKTVAVSQRHAHTRSELRAADYELSTVGELLDAVDAGEADGRYLYDCSLPLKLPSLLQAVRVPRYFAHDFLMRTMRLHAFSASWPSLFVAAAGTQSSLHVDQWQGHFWMAMVRGTKRWTLFNAADLHLLSPDWGRNTLDPAMPPLDELDGLDDKAGGERRHALARLARRYEVDLGPGEVRSVAARAALPARASATRRQCHAAAPADARAHTRARTHAHRFSTCRGGGRTTCATWIIPCPSPATTATRPTSSARSLTCSSWAPVRATRWPIRSARWTRWTSKRQEPPARPTRRAWVTSSLPRISSCRARPSAVVRQPRGAGRSPTTSSKSLLPPDAK